MYVRVGKIMIFREKNKKIELFKFRSDHDLYKNFPFSSGLQQLSS